MNTDTPQTSKLETIEMATNALYWLLPLFTAIRKASDKHSQAHELAKVGEYLAQDQANLIDCLREEYQAMEDSQ